MKNQGFLIKMECVVFEAFVVAFGHDKSHLRRDKYHLNIFMRKPFIFHLITQMLFRKNTCSNG
jgi:hypothetical protein